MRNELAVEDYSRVIELNPNDTRVRYNRGMAHLDLVRFERAIRDFSVVTDAEPENAGAYVARACAHTMRGNHGKAVRDYDRLVLLLPEDPSIRREEREQAVEWVEKDRG